MPAKPFREQRGQRGQSSGRLTTASKGQKVAEQEERGDLEEAEAPVKVRDQQTVKSQREAKGGRGRGEE